jgi:hypothetical protein
MRARLDRVLLGFQDDALRAARGQAMARGCIGLAIISESRQRTS